MTALSFFLFIAGLFLAVGTLELIARQLDRAARRRWRTEHRDNQTGPYQRPW